ncbi:hypothetical protein CTAYLR_008238, partial [Chrysophaeum taylorii]
MAAAIWCEDVMFAYKVDAAKSRVLETPRAALRGVSVALPRGARAVLVGPNGAGKSTLLQVVAGRHTVDAGCVRTEPESARVALVATEGWGRNMASLNVGELVDAAFERSGDPAWAGSLRRALRLDRLRHRETRLLSDGEMRRVQLFATLASKPDIALLDEACAELDVVCRADAIETLGDVACVYATHVFDGLEAWPTHVVRMDRGRVVEVRQDLEVAQPRKAPRPVLVDDEVAIDVRGLTWAYDARPALRDLFLTVRRGSRVVLAGLNGSGKTTLLQILAGARLSPGARVRVLGSDPTASNLRAAGRVALLGGAFKAALADLLPVSSRVPFSNLIAGPRATALARALEIDPAWTPADASSGQRTRMQLVLQLATPAELYLVDEITRDLDVDARDTVLTWLARDGATVLYATHVLRGLESWATHVAHVSNGTVRAYLPTNQLPQGGTLYATVLAWLRQDDAAGPLMEEEEQDHEEIPEPTKLPVGWARHRDNTVEASFGAHSWAQEARRWCCTRGSGMMASMPR